MAAGRRVLIGLCLALLLASGAMAQEVSYEQVRPILDQRCVVCHACFDAPCQLNLTSMAGLRRGASQQPVYDGRRLLATRPTRLGVDAHTPEAWRALGFFDVLAGSNAAQSDADNSSLIQNFLDLKQTAPPPQGALLDQELNIQRQRDLSCPAPNEWAAFARAHPNAGMPYGLPALSPKEHQLLSRWLQLGAPGSDDQVLDAALTAQIQDWERFFNQSSNRARLMSRYLFEHLYPAHLYFAETALQPRAPLDANGRPKHFFNLVRSRTPPGEAIDIIATRRPFDDPGVERVYYRLQRVTESIVEKTHMPYALFKARRGRWQKWFIEDQPPLQQLPSYVPEMAANPFQTFQDLPVKVRYQFLLETAQYTVMAFIKGPVCRGQVALSVINDHFWVFFVDPEVMSDEENARFLSENFQNLQLPASDESTVSPFRWLKYVEREYEFLQSKSRFIQRAVSQRVPVNLDLLWDGAHLTQAGQLNPNAALTVFRHDDTASVVQGLWGGQPQTAWLINYDLLERIHYLLVAGFDVFGNVGHQLSSRIYMDFLRMESELQFLSLLPRSVRQQVHQRWYRGSVEPVKKFLFKYGANFDVPTDLVYRSDDPLRELYQRLGQRFAALPKPEHALQADSPGTLKLLQQLDHLQGMSTRWLPEASVIQLRQSSGEVAYFTLLHHTAWTNISYLFEDEDRRLPEEDGVTLLRGVVGAHPNAFFSVRESELLDFLVCLAELRSEDDYARFKARYGIRRTDRRFWSFADSLHAAHHRQQPLTAGWLDFSRLENR